MGQNSRHLIPKDHLQTTVMESQSRPADTFTLSLQLFESYSPHSVATITTTAKARTKSIATSTTPQLLTKSEPLQNSHKNLSTKLHVIPEPRKSTLGTDKLVLGGTTTLTPSATDHKNRVMECRTKPRNTGPLLDLSTFEDITDTLDLRPLLPTPDEGSGESGSEVPEDTLLKAGNADVEEIDWLADETLDEWDVLDDVLEIDQEYEIVGAEPCAESEGFALEDCCDGWMGLVFFGGKGEWMD